MLIVRHGSCSGVACGTHSTTVLSFCPGIAFNFFPHTITSTVGFGAPPDRPLAVLSGVLISSFAKAAKRGCGTCEGSAWQDVRRYDKRVAGCWVALVCSQERSFVSSFIRSVVVASYIRRCARGCAYGKWQVRTRSPHARAFACQWLTDRNQAIHVSPGASERVLSLVAA